LPRHVCRHWQGVYTFSGDTEPAVTAVMAASHSGPIEAERNLESWYLTAEEDDKEPRTLWTWEKCPLHEACGSSESWKKARCWSWISPEKVMCYAKHHLMYSTLHTLTSDEADDHLISNADNSLQSSLETYEEP
jgi:hypothetical protein